MNIIYRKAKKEDSYRLAELDSIAGDGAIEFLFHDLVPNMSPIDIVAEGYYKDRYPHSYRNAIVAEHKGSVIGMSLSFPGLYHRITEEMISFFPEERIKHFHDFFTVPVENDYFLDALCVESGFKRNGIGRALLEYTEEKAVNEDFHSLALLVWKDNEAGVHFYKEQGFAIISQVSLEYHSLMPHNGGCLLMRKHLK